MNKTSELDIEIIKEDLGKTSFIGEVKSGFLTEAQMQAQVGLGWILSDGRDVTGSQYETVTGNTHVPDTRGKFLRSLDNGAGIDPGRALASEQGEDFKSHSHSGGSDTVNIKTNTNQSFVNTSNQLLRGRFESNNSTTSYTFPSIGSTGGSETRPKNIAVNYFIRIN